MSNPCGPVAESPERRKPEAEGGAGDANLENFPCIRCGVCCGIYHVRVGRSEGERIAEHLGMEFYDWVGRYCEPRWPDPRSYLIRHENGGCIFLERAKDERFALCSIYPVRPVSCREWAAEPDKPACAQGLSRFWNVNIDDEGRIVGDPDAVQRVRGVLETFSS
jgi:Fe-S-cluster containining protein